MPGPLDSANAPYGPEAPAYDALPIAAPASDVDITALGEEFFEDGARAFVALSSGVIAVRTLAGEDRQFAGLEGLTYLVAISHVLAATTSDLLLYGG